MLIEIIIAKNEADIIQEHLDESHKHFDCVAFLDNGSDDGTYELAKHHPAVGWSKQDKGIFQCSMRQSILKDLEAKKMLKPGDWIYLLAADHLYFGSLRLNSVPSTFVSTSFS